MKLATVVVCYYPCDELPQNMASYSKDSDFLYVWDNTPGGSKVVETLQDVVVMHHNHQNMGLAYAYNRAIEEAVKDGATHIMTMDQDSSFERFEVFISAIEQRREKSVGMFVPPINESGVNRNKLVSWAAQSGCVFDMEMIRKVGMFREDFFIGMVDVEMQLRAKIVGYKILQIGGCNLIHKVGSGRNVFFLGEHICVSDYGPLRHYYDSRNRILMWKEFPNDFEMKGKTNHMLGRIKVMIKILLFENDKVKKIFAITRGTWNGLLGRVKPY